MKLSLTFVLIISSVRLAAQDDIKVFASQEGALIAVYASNTAYCPVSVELTMELTNMKVKDGKHNLILVPARAEKFKMLELEVVNPKKGTSYSFRFEFNLGDIRLEKYDDGHVYDLPFRKGNKFLVGQGYNGKASHQDIKALDFVMPEGTEVTASRNGTVVRVKEDNTESCPREECKQFNNYVIVYHDDGTMAEYTHIKKSGAKVKVGDAVRTGDLIAYSGNTGWTTGPHLHFICFLPRMTSRTSIPTKFKVGDGNEVTLLEEKSWYTRGY